jgi:heme iron utilization protein
MSDDDPGLDQEERLVIDEAAQQAEEKSDPASDVRHWLLSTKTATLCTLSSREELCGFPFGSVVPFAVDAEGHPFIMIADIAAHTANLRKDSRANLFVCDPAAQGDPQSTWRVGLMGKLQRVLPDTKESRYRETAQVLDHEQYIDLHARYLERVPKAEGYLAQHSFDYWRMNQIVTARYIAGFGRICWIGGERLLRDPLSGGIGKAAKAAVDHMNTDHVGNMLEMCSGLYGFTPQTAQMISLTNTGFRLRTTQPNREMYFSFEREIDESELRGAIIGVLQRARL